MNVINRIVDLFRKRRILKAARKCGCDVDGDVLVYKGTTYFVYCLLNYVIRINKAEPNDKCKIDYVRIIHEGENHGK